MDMDCSAWIPTRINGCKLDSSIRICHLIPAQKLFPDGTETAIAHVRIDTQRVTMPERCARFIAGAIAQLTGNDTYRQKLLHVEKVTPMRQWSARQASKLKKSDYRQGYLVQRRN